jgi:beta-lactamase superfamily II metal-dependent hydrolase
MAFILEALPARHGDALLLHFGTDDDAGLAMIDAGPAGVLNQFVLPRLVELSVEKKVADGERLTFDLGIVSHIDDDHINGIAALTKRLIDDDPPVDPPCEFLAFWHNSFNDVLADDATELQSADVMTASVSQGMKVRDNLTSLGIDGNVPFGGLILNGSQIDPIKGTTFKVVAPLHKNLVALQQDWAKRIKELAKKGKKAEVADFVDESVPNLSSLVLLVEQDGKSMLLTGDGRGDDTLTGLEDAGIIPKGGKLHVDILKLPHHGSDRNVAPEYFERITADHYVISADGRHHNPDLATLEMLSNARPNEQFTIYITHTPEEFADKAVAEEAQHFFDNDPNRAYDVVWRNAADRSIRIEL